MAGQDLINHDHIGGDEVILHFESNYRRRLTSEEIEIRNLNARYDLELINRANCMDDLVKRIHLSSPYYECAEI